MDSHHSLGWLYLVSGLLRKTFASLPCWSWITTVIISRDFFNNPGTLIYAGLRVFKPSSLIQLIFKKILTTNSVKIIQWFISAEQLL